VEVPAWVVVVINAALVLVIGIDKWTRRRDVDSAVAATKLLNVSEELKTLHRTGSEAMHKLTTDVAVLKNDHENLKRYIAHVTDGDR
jgi:hypothetical protein